MQGTRNESPGALPESREADEAIETGSGRDDEGELGTYGRFAVSDLESSQSVSLGRHAKELRKKRKRLTMVRVRGAMLRQERWWVGVRQRGGGEGSSAFGLVLPGRPSGPEIDQHIRYFLA